MNTNCHFYYAFLSFFILLFCNSLSAQVAIKQDSSSADSSAQLDIQAIDRGFLLPRLTKDQRLAIPSPTAGLFLFQTDHKTGFQYNTDSMGNWQRMIAWEEMAIAEPRVPLDELDPDGDGSLTISQPGSYYLRDTLIVTSSRDGIYINSDNVTIDLNGHAIIARSQNANHGIRVGGRKNNITIKNGTIAGFPLMGIFLWYASNSTFENLLLKDNGKEGLTTGENCLVVNCVATGNGASGFHIDYGCVIRDCTASFNALDGINVFADGCTIYNCTANNNGKYGIDTGWGCRVEACTVYENTEYGIDLGRSSICINNLAYRNGRHGLHIQNNGLVINNISNENGVCIDNSTCENGGGTGTNTSDGVGIRTFANSVLINNQCHGNYFGIVTASTDVTVIGNDVQKNNHAGILASSSGSLFLQNTAHGNGFAQAPGVTNTGDYPLGNIVFDEDVFDNSSHGPIIEVMNVGDISTISNSDHPFANFVY